MVLESVLPGMKCIVKPERKPVALRYTASEANPASRSPVRFRSRRYRQYVPATRFTSQATGATVGWTGIQSYSLRRSF